MGTIFYHGRRVTTTDTGFAESPANQQRFYIPNALGTPMIAYAMGFLGGRSAGGTAYPRLAVASVSSGGAPDTRLAYTEQMTITNPMSYGGDGQPHTANLTAPVLLNPAVYALGIANAGDWVGYAMRQASEIQENNESFYTKSNIGGNIPTNPVGGSQSNEGHMDVWLIGVTNTAPKTPTSLSPSGNVQGTDITPILAATFSDDEITLPNGVQWDVVAQAHVQVRRKSDGAIFWDYAYATTPNEQNADRSSIEYAGTALVAGTDYEWRIRHADRAGAWSAFTAWTTFNINPGGTVSAPTSPSGKVNSATPSTVTAGWSHVGGLSANGMQARLLQNGNPIHTTGTYAVNVAPGGNLTASWGALGWGSLPSGTFWDIQVRGRDTSGAWSPWSPSGYFFINATPNIPSGLNPTNSQPVSGYPILDFKTSDWDNATANLTGTVEITRANGTTVTRTATYNASTDSFRYQTTATDLPSFQTFRWRARATDGVFTSPYSAQATVIYGEGPAVTITAPTTGQTIQVSTPVITWTATGQVKRQVLIYRASDDVLVHDSGDATTASQTYTVPSSILRNGVAYYAVVKVTNSAPLTGTSASVPFSISFPAPATIQGFVAYPITVGSDPSPSAVEMDWEPTYYPAGRFVGYDVYRRAVNTDVFGIGTDPAEGVRLRRITSPLQTSFIDYHPQPGVEHEYWIRQVITTDLDILESAPASARATANVEGIVIASALNPSVYRADLRYLGSNDVDMPLRMNSRQVVRIGAKRGRTIRTAFQSWEPSGTFIIATDLYGTADERIAALRQAVLNGRTFSYRDYKGRKLWVTISDYAEVDRSGYYIVQLKFREEDFTEGEVFIEGEAA